MLRLFTTPVGRILISVLWGLALAALFRQSCTGSRCIVIQGPPLQDVVGKTFQYEGDQRCYRFQPIVTSCPAAAPSSRPLRTLDLPQ